MSKTLAIGLFLALLVVGIAFGIARDLYSTERAVLSGEILDIDAGGRDYKSPSMRTASLKAKLADGRVVDVAITKAHEFKTGSKISISEMVMPWGQVWYQSKPE